jgi:hypothetical protein
VSTKNLQPEDRIPRSGVHLRVLPLASLGEESRRKLARLPFALAKLGRRTWQSTSTPRCAGASCRRDYMGTYKMSLGIIIYSILSVIYSFYMLSIVANPHAYHAPIMIRAGYILTAILWSVFGIGILKKYSWARIGLLGVATLYFIDYITYPPKRIIADILDHTIRPTWVLGVIFFVSLFIYFMRPKVKQQFENSVENQKRAINEQRDFLREKIKQSLSADSVKRHPLLFAWYILKLIWIYLVYLRFGGEERFYISKANCYVALQWYDRAIIYYEKALMESDRAAVHSMLGYCYEQIQENNKSVEHYRKAYKRRRDRSSDIWLAEAEFKLGNIEKSYEVIQELRKSKFIFEGEAKKKLDDLEAKINQGKMIASDMA